MGEDKTNKSAIISMQHFFWKTYYTESKILNRVVIPTQSGHSGQSGQVANTYTQWSFFVKSRQT